MKWSISIQFLCVYVIVLCFLSGIMWLWVMAFTKMLSAIGLGTIGCFGCLILIACDAGFLWISKDKIWIQGCWLYCSRKVIFRVSLDTLSFFFLFNVVIDLNLAVERNLQKNWYMCGSWLHVVIYWVSLEIISCTIFLGLFS